MGGSESRVDFQSKLDRLQKDNISPVDEYWTALFNSSLSLSEIFELISPEDVRQLRADKKLNLNNLLKRLVITLRDHIDEVACGDAPQPTREVTSSLLTCVRLLTRIMPFLLEDPQEEFTKSLFWRPGGYISPVQQEFREQTSSFEIKESDSATAKDRYDTDVMTVGVELLASLQRLLFLKGFCCLAPGVALSRDEVLPRHKLDTRFIWKGGIGTFKNLPTTTNSYITKNRTEVLRCILVCLSGSLYQTIDEYQHVAPIWLRVFTRGELPYTANIFSSLMSNIFSYDPVGYGVPYSSVFSSYDNEELVQISIQLLCVLYDYNPSLFFSRHGPHTSHYATTAPSSAAIAQQSNVDSASILTTVDSVAPEVHSRVTDENDSPIPISRGGSTEQPAKLGRNVYRSMLSSIKKEVEINFLFEGFVKLLSTSLNAKNTYLPNSKQPIAYNQEILLVLWQLLTSNDNFLKKVTARQNSNQLLCPILYLLLEESDARTADMKKGSSGPSRVGVLHMCSFLLLVLSSERDFAVRLNDPHTDKFPLGIPIFQGTHADLLVLCIYRVVVDSTATSTSDSLIDMLLTVMCNVSAYVKSFCLESCVKLLNLLQRFSRPSWLFSGPYHYHDVFFLLDMFNNLIQYQYEGNQQLVYSILRQKEFFSNLQNLQFPTKFSESKNADMSDQSSEARDAQLADGIDQAVKDTHPHSSTRDENSSALQNPSAGLEATPATGATGASDKWSPTIEWFLDWKAKLPLQTISRLIGCLLPMVELECQEKSVIDQSEVLQFLHKTTLVGLLPVPHPIIIRNYQPNVYTSLWFTSYMWGVLFTQSQTLVLYDWRKIRLIVINNKDSLPQDESRKASFDADATDDTLDGNTVGSKEQTVVV